MSAFPFHHVRRPFAFYAFTHSCIHSCLERLQDDNKGKNMLKIGQFQPKLAQTYAYLSYIIIIHTTWNNIHDTNNILLNIYKCIVFV